MILTFSDGNSIAVEYSSVQQKEAPQIGIDYQEKNLNVNLPKW